MSLLVRRSPASGVSLLCSHRMYPGMPVQATKKSSAYYSTPHELDVPRPYQGMDMRKLLDYPWVNVLETRKPMPSGYSWGNWGGSYTDALEYKDIPMYFTQRTWWNDYTFWQMLKLTYPHLRYMAMVTTNILIAAGPAVLFAFYMQRFEPNEMLIEPDEYFENYRWHYYGPDLDHHAFLQYLEARRAKKWRDSTIDPKKWIPPKFRGEYKF